MLMADHEMKTTAPDTGLRIKTEIKVQDPGAAVARRRARPTSSCRNVNLSYGDNQVLHDVTMDMEAGGSPPSSAPRAAASRRSCAASTG